MAQSTVENEDGSSSLIILPQQSEILENQKKIIENQHKIMLSLAKLQTYFEIFSSSTECNATPSSSVLRVEKLSKPINSLNELKELEEHLKDSCNFRKYIANMSYICGTDGKLDGVDCSYKLIDFFFTREFLTRCSWTGYSRPNDENKSVNTPEVECSETGKVPLKFYGNVRRLFLELILLADKDYTELKCEDFLKRVMRNSKQRLESKASSKHKNRPKNLTYAPRAKNNHIETVEPAEKDPH